jgi:hypothetical protein
MKHGLHLTHTITLSKRRGLSERGHDLRVARSGTQQRIPRLHWYERDPT